MKSARVLGVSPAKGRPAVRLSDKSTAPISYSAAFLLPAAGSPCERDFLLPSRSPALFSAAAGLWRRGCWTRFSFPAACRYTHTLRQTLSGLLRCLLDDALRQLADYLQMNGSFPVAHSVGARVPCSPCHEQCDTGATHEIGKIVHERGFFSQGANHG